MKFWVDHSNNVRTNATLAECNTRDNDTQNRRIALEEKKWDSKMQEKDSWLSGWFK